MDNYSPRFANCPRCGDQSYEHLKNHSFCSNCNYSPTLDEDYQYMVPQWAQKALKDALKEDPKFQAAPHSEKIKGMNSKDSDLFEAHLEAL